MSVMPASPTELSGRRHAPGEALCVLWHPRGSVPEPYLTDSLRQKGFRTIACDNPVEAAAWVCSSIKSHAAPAPPSRAVVLLMDRPGLLLGADQMQEMLARYAPSAACWTHDPTLSPRLRAASSEPKSPPRQPSPPPRAAPSLRLAGQGPIHEVKPPTAPDENLLQSGPVPESGSLRELLSDDELAMLLDDPPPPPPTKPPHRRSGH